MEDVLQVSFVVGVGCGCVVGCSNDLVVAYLERSQCAQVPIKSLSFQQLCCHQLTISNSNNNDNKQRQQPWGEQHGTRRLKLVIPTRSKIKGRCHWKQ